MVSMNLVSPFVPQKSSLLPWRGIIDGTGGQHEGFHFHVEFHPPLRRPNLLKYLAGPEIGGGNFLSDTSPEEKAAELRAAPDVHYKKART